MSELKALADFLHEDGAIVLAALSTLALIAVASYHWKTRKGWDERCTTCRKGCDDRSAAQQKTILDALTNQVRVTEQNTEALQEMRRELDLYGQLQELTGYVRGKRKEA